MRESDGPSKDPRVSALMTGARKLAEDEDYPTAVGQLELALDIDPGNTEVLELLAEVRETLVTRPKELRIEKLLAEARAYSEQGETGRARAIAEQVFEIDEDNQDALDILSRPSTHDESPPDQSCELPPPPPESPLSDESLRLIEKIDGLLSRPRSDPAADNPSRITAGVEEGDAEEAQEAQAVLVAPGDDQGEEQQPDEMALQPQESREPRDPRAGVDTGPEKPWEEQERSRMMAVIHQLLEDARFREARWRLAEAETRWGRAGELADLRNRLDQLERWEFETRVRRPRERPSPVRPFRTVALALIGLVIALAIVFGGRQQSPASTMETGTIKVVLASEGYTVLDDFEHPDEGRNLQQIHHFRNVPTGHHTITIWRPGNPDRLNTSVTVESGKTTEYRE